MKHIFKISLSILSGIVLFSSCKKNEIKYGEFDLVGANQSLFKVNFLSQYKSAPTVVFIIDGKRVNNPITARTPFPGGGLNTGGGSTANYMVMDAGSHELKVVVPSRITLQDSLELYKTNVTLEAGKYQTLHITDTADNTFSTLITDNLARPDSGKVRYRFINLIPNSPALNLYYDSTLMAENVAYQQTVEFTKASGTVAATRGWWVRDASAASNIPAAVSYTTASGVNSSQQNQRVFTIFTSGYLGLPSSDTRRGYLSFVFNL